MINRTPQLSLLRTRLNRHGANHDMLPVIVADLGEENLERASLILASRPHVAAVNGERNRFRRGDSGFAREALMAWCEANRVDFLFGLARNERLEGAIKAELISATLDRWSRSRRVVGKAEVTGGEANPQFVVTSLKSREAAGKHLYEKVYCARGEMENRIKECQLDLFADRTSTATRRANQLRLRFASMAYVLLCALRHIGLAHTQFAQATCGTIRLKLLKLGALVRVSVQRIKVAMASACLYQNEFALVYARFRNAAAA